LTVDHSPEGLTPRRLWEREPVRVISAFFTMLTAINAVLLGVSAYSGAVAGAVTGVLGAAAAFANEVFTRSEVVPLKPLEDLAAADKAA